MGSGGASWEIINELASPECIPCPFSIVKGRALTTKKIYYGCVVENEKKRRQNATTVLANME